jgi:hypothetical protein
VRKHFLLAVGMAAALTSQVASAQRNYGMAGCGLGSILFKPSGNQSSAATTNGSSGNQTFGITLGTSNCVPSGGAAALRQEEFFVANFAALSKEIAQGGGESVTGFAGTLGCASTHTSHVAAALKSNYQAIFSEPGAIAAFDAATASLRDDGEIKSHCSLL